MRIEHDDEWHVQIGRTASMVMIQVGDEHTWHRIPVTADEARELRRALSRAIRELSSKVPA